MYVKELPTPTPASDNHGLILDKERHLLLDRHVNKVIVELLEDMVAKGYGLQEITTSVVGTLAYQTSTIRIGHIIAVSKKKKEKNS